MDKIKRKEERIIVNKKGVAYIFLGIIHFYSVRGRTNILVAFILVSARKTNSLQDLPLLYFKVPQQNFFSNSFPRFLLKFIAVPVLDIPMTCLPLISIINYII